MTVSKESFTFTVGKLDAGMAILLGERAHLIEFPSILLPPGATAGSIVNIAVQQNHDEEERRDREFWGLQNDILEEFGRESPEPPKLELRNVTQTSVTLEWPALKLATAKVRSLDIYRNGQRLSAIPAPLQNTSTKLSGLDLDAEYTFQLILRTTAGVYPSNVVRVRTHTMTDTSGISVCFGNVQDPVLLEHAKLTLGEMRACWSDKIQIDTTHFVCTTPAATPAGAQAGGNVSSAPGVEYQRALQLSIPVVQPQWVLACHEQGRMVPISSYYLGATPSAPINAPPFMRPQSMSQISLSQSPTRQGSLPSGTPNTPPTSRSPMSNRASMPPMARVISDGPMSPSSAETLARMQAFPPTAEEPAEPPASSAANAPQPSPKRQDSSPVTAPAPPTSQAVYDDDGAEEVDTDTENDRKSRRRTGTMNKDFKFPPTAGAGGSAPPPVPSLPLDVASPRSSASAGPMEVPEPTPIHVITPASIEVPAPPPVEKERPAVSEDVDDDVGATEEIPL